LFSLLPVVRAEVSATFEEVNARVKKRGNKNSKALAIRMVSKTLREYAALVTLQQIGLLHLSEPAGDLRSTVRSSGRASAAARPCAHGGEGESAIQKNVTRAALPCYKSNVGLRFWRKMTYKNDCPHQQKNRSDKRGNNKTPLLTVFACYVWIPDWNDSHAVFP